MPGKVFLASATGATHLAQGRPCEDAGCVLRADDCLVAVVCDGAGSAAQGGEGAGFFSREIAQGVLDGGIAGLLTAGASTGTPVVDETLLAALQGAIEGARSRLQSELRPHACTLVGCALGRGAGVFFHIGDGFAICQQADGSSTVSLPENGEYSDETYFVTDEAWREHLRCTPFVPPDDGGVIGLMSDGAATFAVNRARDGFFRPFLDPVLRHLRSEPDPDRAQQALQALLASERTLAITADDKTLLLVLPA